MEMTDHHQDQIDECTSIQRQSRRVKYNKTVPAASLLTEDSLTDPEKNEFQGLYSPLSMYVLRNVTADNTVSFTFVGVSVNKIVIFQ